MFNESKSFRINGSDKAFSGLVPSMSLSALTLFCMSVTLLSSTSIRTFSGVRVEVFLSAVGNDSNLLIVFYVQIMPDDFVMQLHRF